MAKRERRGKRILLKERGGIKKCESKEGAKKYEGEKRERGRIKLIPERSQSEVHNDHQCRS